MPLCPTSKSCLLRCSGIDQRGMVWRSMFGNRSKEPMKNRDLQTKQRNRMATLVFLLVIAALCRLLLLSHF